MSCPPPEYTDGVDKAEWSRQWNEWNARQAASPLWNGNDDSGISSPSAIEFCGDRTPSATGVLETSYDLPAAGGQKVCCMPPSTYGEKRTDGKMWETIPYIKPCTHPQWHKTVHRWYFSKATRNGNDMLIFEIELCNGTQLRHVLYTSQIKEVLTLSKRDDPVHRVILDIHSSGMFWTPTQISYKFMDPENSLAFQMSLITYLSNQEK